jgi:hypothetical protein
VIVESFFEKIEKTTLILLMFLPKILGKKHKDTLMIVQNFWIGSLPKISKLQRLRRGVMGLVKVYNFSKRKLGLLESDLSENFFLLPQIIVEDFCVYLAALLKNDIFQFFHGRLKDNPYKLYIIWKPLSGQYLWR